jgi:hypothetical protein
MFRADCGNSCHFKVEILAGFPLYLSSQTLMPEAFAGRTFSLSSNFLLGSPDKGPRVWHVSTKDRQVHSPRNGCIPEEFRVVWFGTEENSTIGHVGIEFYPSHQLFWSSFSSRRLGLNQET